MNVLYLKLHKKYKDYFDELLFEKQLTFKRAYVKNKTELR